MWQKSYSAVTKDITKEQIRKLYTDINHWKDWDDSVEDSKLLREFKVGNSFMLKPKGGPKVNIRLVEIIENRKFKDETKFFLARMYGEHVFEDTTEGLRITVTMTVTGPLQFLWVKLVAKDIVANLPKDINNQIAAAKQIIV